MSAPKTIDAVCIKCGHTGFSFTHYSTVYNALSYACNQCGFDLRRPPLDAADDRERIQAIARYQALLAAPPLAASPVAVLPRLPTARVVSPAFYAILFFAAALVAWLLGV